MNQCLKRYCQSVFHLLCIVLWTVGERGPGPEGLSVGLPPLSPASSHWTLSQAAWPTHCPVYTSFVFLPLCLCPIFLCRDTFLCQHECNSLFKSQPGLNFSLEVFLSIAVCSRQEYSSEPLKAERIIHISCFSPKSRICLLAAVHPTTDHKPDFGYLNLQLGMGPSEPRGQQWAY